MDKLTPQENGNLSAMPWHRPGEIETGLTKREHFAAMAMQGLMSSEEEECVYSDLDTMAKRAVSCADALLRALAAGGEG